MPPTHEVICLLALGMAIANKPFSKLLTKRVGKTAFEGLAADLYSQIESLAADMPTELPHKAIAFDLELNGRDKLSEAILGYLESAAWEFFQERENELAKLNRVITEATVRLGKIAERKRA